MMASAITIYVRFSFVHIFHPGSRLSRGPRPPALTAKVLQASSRITAILRHFTLLFWQLKQIPVDVFKTNSNSKGETALSRCWRHPISSKLTGRWPIRPHRLTLIDGKTLKDILQHLVWSAKHLQYDCGVNRSN